MPLDTIVVADTETTGTDPAAGAQLLEVALVAIERGDDGVWTIGHGESSLIAYDADQYGPIPPDARAVHHISEQDVHPSRHSGRAGDTGVYSRELLLHGLLAAEVPGEMAYAAHSADFDSAFLPELGADRDGVSPIPWICTWRCARHIWPEAPAYGNQVLRYWLGVEPPPELLVAPGIAWQTRPDGRLVALDCLVPLAPHRALYDAAVTAAILARMLETHSPEELVALTTTPINLRTVSFGRYRDEKWEDVPRGYLFWLRRESDMYRGDADLRHTVDTLLERGR